MNKQKPTATSRNVLVLAALVAALGIAVLGVQQLANGDWQLAGETQNQKLTANSQPLTATPNVAGARTFSYRGVEGQTALELLKENYDVKTTKYSFGEMVTSIAGIEAGDENFWAFYVNGKMSPVGAGELVTRDGQLVEWKLEKVE